MTWRDFWEAIGSFFEDVLFIPLDALRQLELETWFGANIVSWIFIAIWAVAFIYWMRQLKKFDENEEVTYTFDENP